MPESNTASVKGRFFRIGLSLTLSLLATSSVKASGLYDLSLERLDSKRTLALGDYHGKTVLLSFFEPDCPWCNRQLKTLEQLSSRCDESLQSIAVGINGREDALRKELRRARVTFPGTRASAALLEQIGEVPATPWTLVMTPGGELAATLRGFVREEPLAAAFPMQCAAESTSK